MYRTFYGPRPIGPYAPQSDHLLFGLLGVVFWVLVIWLVFRLLTHHGHHFAAWQHSHNDDPLQIIKARYARGEINKTEYEQLKKDLG